MGDVGFGSTGQGREGEFSFACRVRVYTRERIYSQKVVVVVVVEVVVTS